MHKKSKTEIENRKIEFSKKRKLDEANFRKWKVKKQKMEKSDDRKSKIRKLENWKIGSSKNLKSKSQKFKKQKRLKLENRNIVTKTREIENPKFE